jgi:hypothetical protein
MGGSGVSKSQVSRLCATYIRVRENVRIISSA